MRFHRCGEDHENTIGEKVYIYTHWIKTQIQWSTLRLDLQWAYQQSLWYLYIQWFQKKGSALKFNACSKHGICYDADPDTLSRSIQLSGVIPGYSRGDTNNDINVDINSSIFLKNRRKLGRGEATRHQRNKFDLLRNS